MKTVEDFEELKSIASFTGGTSFCSSRHFRFIRILLRVLSLWRPMSAGFLESYIYPVVVNLLLLTFGIIRNSIQSAMKPTWLSIQLLYLVHEVVVWLGHILANRYFASRDLETNVLKPVKSLKGFFKPLNRRLKVLTAAVIISMLFFSVMLSTLFIMTKLTWNKGAARFSADLPKVNGPVDNILYVLVLLTLVYDLGIGLALFWTLALLYICYATRLRILEDIFLTWKHSSVEAISFFMQLYARPVKNSWKRISWWFLAQNIVALAIPLYGYELAQAVTGREYHSKHLPQFVCYLIFTLTIWLAPIVVGELVKRREKKFEERINNICPWLLGAYRVHCLGDSITASVSGDSGVYVNTNACDLTDDPRHDQTASLHTTGSTSTETSDRSQTLAEYTFAYRGKEFRRFLSFLKRRTPGLVSRGYSLQLNLSIISLIGGAISFLTELHAKSSHDMMYRNYCNCTM